MYNFQVEYRLEGVARGRKKKKDGRCKSGNRQNLRLRQSAERKPRFAASGTHAPHDFDFAGVSSARPKEVEWLGSGCL